MQIQKNNSNPNKQNLSNRDEKLFINKFLDSFKNKNSGLAEYFYDNVNSLKTIYKVAKLAKNAQPSVQEKVFSLFHSIILENRQFLEKKYFIGAFNYPDNYWLAQACLIGCIGFTIQQVDKLLAEIALDKNFLPNIRTICLSGLFLRSGIINGFNSKDNVEIFDRIINDKTEKDNFVVGYAYKYYLLYNILTKENNFIYKTNYWKKFISNSEFSSKVLKKEISSEINSLRKYYSI